MTSQTKRKYLEKTYLAKDLDIQRYPRYANTQRTVKSQ